MSSHVTGTSLIVDASMCKAPVSDLIKKLEPQLQARLDQMDSFALLPPTGADNERDMRQAWKKTCRAVEGDPSRISARTFLKHYEDSVLMRSMGSILAKHGFPRVSIDNFYPIRGSSHDPCDGTVMPPAIWFGRPRPAMRQGR
ncbi:hypothetical protein [Lysobacter sp. GCM10012299]|uniref:hypothetical protein n=1 Tax=Lysobacter sp. GCM10012299 TaxID=3317333 RepID=UPI00361F5B9C